MSAVDRETLRPLVRTLFETLGDGAPVHASEAQKLATFEALFAFLVDAGTATSTSTNEQTAKAQLWHLYLYPAWSQFANGNRTAEDFELVYADLEDSILATQATWVHWAPLTNFRWDGEYIALSNGCEVRRLTDDEREYLQDRSSLGPVGLLHLGLIGVTHAIATRLVTRKDAGLTHLPDEAMLEQCLSVLRMIKRGLVSFNYIGVSLAAPRFGLDAHLGPCSGMWSAAKGSSSGEPYVLSTEDLENLSSLVDGLISPLPRTVRKALDRFNFSYERARPEDRVVDYWVALESLFLADLEQELSFRAAIRIAYFLASKPAARQGIFEQVKRSYDLRSWIVHGESESKKKRKKWPPETVSSVAFETEEILRSALRICVQYPGEPRVTNLDSLVAEGSVYTPTKEHI